MIDWTSQPYPYFARPVYYSITSLAIYGELGQGFPSLQISVAFAHPKPLCLTALLLAKNNLV